jgi:predicted RNA-binding Zn-ribbon protein involved in translation (DUF1610 family)
MLNENTFLCPFCGFTGLEEPPYDEFGCASFEICPSCGTEFGYHDAKTSHRELRQRWLASGAHWHSATIEPPVGWDPIKQLKAAQLAM